jgi:peroxiredoxin-like protein
MSKEYIYDVNLCWKEGRIGELSSPVLDHNVEVATPPEFDKGVEGVWSPEHLFISAVSSCLMTTFLAMAEFSKLEFESFSCAAKGTLGKVDGKFAVDKIVLKPVVVIKDEKDREKADRLLHKAEGACLISNSVKTEITMETEIQVG